MASVTASLSKYRDDPFFRAEVNIVSLQLCFAVVVVAIIGLAALEIDRSINSTIRDGIHQAIHAQGMQVSPAASDAIDKAVDKVQTIRLDRIELVIFVILIIALIFSALMSSITLSPARGALSAQKQFIGNIAHELRTPLSVIKTNSEIMLLDQGLGEEVRRTFESNVEELDRISEIINNLLTLSNLINPERIEFAKVEVREVTSEAIKKFDLLARKGAVEVALRAPEEQFAWGNETAVRQIIENILKNAIVYTPRAGKVLLTLHKHINTDFLELSVRDSGIGIPRKDLLRIFEPFYRADPSRVRGQGGSGLGLTITSELVKIHGGRISVRSAVGQGTTVTVLLPTYREPKERGHEAAQGELFRRTA